MEFSKNYIKYIYILLCCVITGVIAHGMMLFSKICFHDDVASFNSNHSTTALSLGRFGLVILRKMCSVIFGSKNYSLPVFNGFISFIFISIFVYTITTRIICINNRLNLLLLSSLSVCFPMVTASFGYMYVAPYYFFSFLLTSFSVMPMNSDKLYKRMIGMLILSFAISIYQVNIAIAVSLNYIYLINKYYTDDCEYLYNFKKIILSLIRISISVVLYIILNKIIIYVFDLELANYKNINSYGMTTISDYIFRILQAYKEFFLPDYEAGYNMYVFSLYYIHIPVIVLSLFGLIKIFKEKKKWYEIVVVALIYPLTVNIPFIMVGKEEVHALMVYSIIFNFIVISWIVEYLNVSNRLDNILRCVLICGMGFYLISYVRFSNMCYVKANILQSQAINYFNGLVVRIKSVEGYNEEIKIEYVNEYKKKTQETSQVYFDDIYICPYDYKSLVNDYSWKEMMSMWVGFSPVIDNSIPDSDIRVQEMPAYPEEGSIKVVDDILIVKF